MTGMTIKQIAELCGVGDTTVRRWIDEAAASAKLAKPSAIMAKVENEPFRFALDETLAIIRAGGNDTLADLLSQNAAPSTPPAIDTSTERINALCIVADAGYITGQDVRYLLGLTGKRSPILRRPSSYSRGNRPPQMPLTEAQRRVSLIPLWPCTMRALGLYLEVSHVWVYRHSHDLGMDVTSGVTREQAEAIVRRAFSLQPQGVRALLGD